MMTPTEAGHAARFDAGFKRLSQRDDMKRRLTSNLRHRWSRHANAVGAAA
jgi:hypothetical protein